MFGKADDRVPLLGILGGMGPAATLDFQQKLLSLTRAAIDQEQIPTIAYSNTQIPDRNDAFLRDGISPVPELVRSAKVLESSGADIIAIPCNTAHIWFSEIQDSVFRKVLNMPDITAASVPEGSKVGIISTTPVRLSGLYSKPLEQRGIRVVHPEDQDRIMDAIYSVKAGKLDYAKDIFTQVMGEFEKEGCTHILAACTEVPVAVSRDDTPLEFIDAMEKLALECIRILGKQTK